MLPHLNSHPSSLPPQPVPPQAASDSREAYYFAKRDPRKYSLLQAALQKVSVTHFLFYHGCLKAIQISRLCK